MGGKKLYVSLYKTTTSDQNPNPTQPNPQSTFSNSYPVVSENNQPTLLPLFILFLIPFPLPLQIIPVAVHRPPISKSKSFRAGSRGYGCLAQHVLTFWLQVPREILVVCGKGGGWAGECWGVGGRG